MGRDDHGNRHYAPDAIHLMRTAQQMQLQLSQMADQKASILMGATFVVFTITVNQAVKGDVSPAVLTLGAFAFISAILAILAVLPAVKAPKDAPLNLMFFGSFTQLGEEEFVDRITGDLDDQDHIFRMMARDMYQNGAVLQRKKYRFLAFAYRAFLIGLIATVAVFALERLSI
jgi:hypothetical protein